MASLRQTATDSPASGSQKVHDLRITPSFWLRWNIVFIYSHKIGACGQRDVNAHFGVLFLVAKFGIKVTVRRGCFSDMAGHGDAQIYLQLWVSCANMLVLCLSRDEELVFARAVCAKTRVDFLRMWMSEAEATFPSGVNVHSGIPHTRGQGFTWLG